MKLMIEQIMHDRKSNTWALAIRGSLRTDSKSSRDFSYSFACNLRSPSW